MTTPVPLEPGLLRLAHADLRLDLAPAIGGSIARFWSVDGDRVTHWLRPADARSLADGDPLGLASFPLVPFCNRIRGGRSDYGALPLRLEPNFRDSPHTIHGVTWRRPWQVAAVDARSAVLVQQHRPEAGHGDWPYAFDARQRFVLSDAGLTIEVEVHNRSGHPMPAGIGHHPYFPHPPGTRLQTRVAAMWEGDDELLPTGLAEPPFLSTLSAGIELAELELDNNFIGWSHEARVDWPEAGSAVLMRAEPPLDYFVLYCPRGADHFCMEPVSNCTDWMNLAAAGIGDAGGALVAPDDTLAGRFELLPLRPS